MLVLAKSLGEKNETTGNEKNTQEKKEEKQHFFLKNMLVGLLVSRLAPPE